MYRPYPAPSSQTLNRPNGNDRSRRNDTNASASQRGSNFSNSTNTGRVPGLSNPVRSPVRPVAPPSKKQRGTAPKHRSSADEFTKLADEGIAKRRAELRLLQSRRSTTADLLLRATAVTSNANANVNVNASSPAPSHRTFSSHGTHANGNAPGAAYPTRTRPSPLPKSPPRERRSHGLSNGPSDVNGNDNSKGTSKSVPPNNQRNITNTNGGISIHTNESNLTKSESPIVASKSNSPNQRVNVHATSVPSSEMSNIKPITTIPKQNTTTSSTRTATTNTVNANAIAGVNAQLKNGTSSSDRPNIVDESKKKISSTNNNAQVPTVDSKVYSTPVMPNTTPIANGYTNPNANPNDNAKTQSKTNLSSPPPRKNHTKLNPNDVNTNVPTKVTDVKNESPRNQSVGPPIKKINNDVSIAPMPISNPPQKNQMFHEEEKKAEHIPPLATEQSKRDTLKLFRDAAKSPAAQKKQKMKQQQQQQQPQKQLQQQQQQSIVEKSDSQNKLVEQSSHSKIMKELLEAKHLRENALKKVAQLEKEVMDLRLERGRSAYRMKERNNRQDRSRSVSRSSTRQRMKSPQPTNRTKNDVNSNPLSDDEIACRAVETVDDVYSSELAMYVVRKPYGGNETMEYNFPQTNCTKKSDFKVSWHEPVDKYLATAKVQEEASIEIIAKVGADNSVLLLYGASCRHGIAVLGNDGEIVDYEWKSYNDIEKMEGSLGRFLYIDANGNDGEYWLDSIYEEALKIRENYCSNVFSAASALNAASPKAKESPQKTSNHQVPIYHEPLKPVEPNSTANNNIHKPKLQTMDACVGTSDDFPLPQVQAQEKKLPKSKPSKQPAEKVDAQIEEESGSTDALSAFVIFFFGTIFSIIWFTCCIPFKLMKWSIIGSLLYGFISITWLYFADDNGAMSYGAGIDYNLNPPGVY
jgi:hypothetical protein